MYKLKKNSAVEQMRVNPQVLNFFILTLKQDYPNLSDHTLIAQLLNQRFKLHVTKNNVNEILGPEIILTECFEDESRKQFYKLKTI
jgi:hypothetical protein